MEQKVEFMELEIIDSDEEFYEHIEAPKFVDFTRPDRYRPVNDRYWFCSRVGCDQKHEEEMDAEAIYKKFVSRVMAARSPHVRRRKPINSEMKKCPLSAPPKPSRSRLPRLAVVTSLSQKFADIKRKPSLKASPKARVKHVSAKYMTSPRNKKPPSKLNPFRSVRNPRRSSGTMPKAKTMAAKALVFSSPRKPIKRNGKTQVVELSTPVTKLCEGMEKLKIASQRKVQHAQKKPLKVSRSRDIKKVMPLDASGKQASARKVGMCFNNLSASKGKDVVRSSKRPANSMNRDSKKKSQQNVQDGGAVGVGEKSGGAGPSEVSVKKLSHDMIKQVGQEECLETVESLINTGSSASHEEATSSDVPKTDAVPSGTTKDDIDSTTNAHGRANMVDEASEAATPDETAMDNKEHESVKPNLLEGNITDNLDLGAGQENNADADDKENALPSNANRDLNIINPQLRRDASSKRSVAVKPKIIQTAKKSLKETCSAGVASQGVKYRKPKLTNPKPFRLRTDERGILKESAIDRKLHEATTENSQCKSEGKGQGLKRGIERRSNRKDQHIRTAFKKTTKQGGGATADEMTPQRLRSFGKGKAKSPCSGKSSRSAKKTSMLQKDVLKPQRPINSVKKPSAGSTTMQEISRNQKGTRKQNQGVAESTNEVAPSANSSRSCRRKQTTIPEVPNFHTRHVPRSCTRHT